MFYPDANSIDPVFQFEITERLASLQAAIEDLRPQRVDSRLRYPLCEAARILGVSQRTLKRRAQIGQLLITRDGKKLFLSGAELLRYSRQTGGGSK
jgi:hypothetical protein